MNKDTIKRWVHERIAACKSTLPVVYQALKDPRTPKLARLLCALAAGYTLSPIDLIPDFIPVLGALDDVILLPLLISAAVKLIPAEVWQKCQIQAQMLPPKQNRYAFGILLIWIGIVLAALKLASLF